MLRDADYCTLYIQLDRASWLKINKLEAGLTVIDSCKDFFFFNAFQIYYFNKVGQGSAY